MNLLMKSKHDILVDPQNELKYGGTQLSFNSCSHLRNELLIEVTGGQCFSVVRSDKVISRVQRGLLTPALRVGPDHSLVSASAKFTVLWPGMKA